MAIIAPSSISDNDETGISYVVLPMLSEVPDLSQDIYPRLPSGLIVGVYNGSTDMVELYVTNTDGSRYLRVTTSAG